MQHAFEISAFAAEFATVISLFVIGLAVFLALYINERRKVTRLIRIFHGKESQQVPMHELLSRLTDSRPTDSLRSLDQILMESFKLESENRLLSQVVNRAKSAIVITDRHGCIEWVNESFLRITGYEFDELRGQKPGKLLQRDDTPPAVKERIRSAIASASPFEEEVVNYSKKGEKYWIHIDAQPLFDQNGNCQGFVAIENEVTIHREAREREREARVAAEDLADIKSRFLANMSHEIRTPLNGVIAAGSILQESKLSFEDRDLVTTITNSAETLLSVINSILDLSKIEAEQLSLDLAPARLRDVLEAVTSIIEPVAAEKGVTVEIESRVPDEFVVLDALRLRQILLNLCSNAVKFTNRGGAIVCAAFNEGLRSGQRKVTFAVSDTGIGVSEYDQQSIFGAFVQADQGSDNTRAGTGLGLSISSRLVELMGGALSLQSRKGVGSCFFFTVELEQQRAGFLDSSFSPVEASYSLQGLDVLLAEDNRVNSRLAQKILESFGCTVTTVENGRQAIEAYAESDFDIVLMDIEMPVLSGDAATKYIRENYSDKQIPIVAVTAHALKDDCENFLRIGMDNYLPKPFRRNDLLRVISETLGLKRRAVEPFASSSVELKH